MFIVNPVFLSLWFSIYRRKEVGSDSKMVLAGSLEERPQTWLDLEVVRMLEKNNSVWKIEHQMLKTKEGIPLKLERNLTWLDPRTRERMIIGQGKSRSEALSSYRSLHQRLL